MQKELSLEEVRYKFNFQDIKLGDNKEYIPEYEQVYKNIKTAIEIDKPGYNIYLVDDFSKNKLENIVNYIKENLKYKNRPKDICYVVYEDEKRPKPMYLSNGMGKILKYTVEDIKKNYSEYIYEFYNSSSNKEKEVIIDNMQKKRSEMLKVLVKMAEERGFDIKFTKGGFAFIPIKDGAPLSEKDFEMLDSEEKQNILNKINELKDKSHEVFKKLKDLELEELDKIKLLMREYLQDKTLSLKIKYREVFKEEVNALEYLDYICNNMEERVLEVYTLSYEDDEASIRKVISKYSVNVIVDNSDNKSPLVIFEEDPSISNLLGNIEYENKNGVYVTDVDLIKAGSILKANEGCIILRINSLLTNPLAYYYLKKTLVTEKVDFDYDKGYLELLSLNGLKPEPIKINEKVILVGDYGTYYLLYTYDEDFRKIFKIKGEYNPIVSINKDTKKMFLDNIFNICKKENLKSLTNDGIIEVAKLLSRKAENKNKFYIENEEIYKILILANNRVINKNKEYIEDIDVREVGYKEELIEKEMFENYKNNVILMNFKEKKIGQINGLSVIDIGYHRFGKPMRITCSCYKGEGNILDVQKESKLSGKIHNKAVNILKGYLSNLIGGYDIIPVDFHLNFEQIYGMVDGDSASVAEVISIFSALSKIPIKQNIAVTGSINQFGEIQPIGGVNEKIEGFFKACDIVDTIENKGVLIPNINAENLVLNKKVEEAIKEKKFHIYTMDKIDDAVEILMGDEKTDIEEVLDSMKKEIKKFASKRRGKF